MPTYRRGRHNDHTLYQQLGDVPGDYDICLGMMTEPHRAQLVVAALNAYAPDTARALRDDAQATPWEGAGAELWWCGGRIGMLLTHEYAELAATALNAYSGAAEPAG